MDGIDEVKSRLSIEDVISEYVQLKRSGRNFKGLSPFSAEKTPSFMVSPEKQIWHDFSSGKGGNVFSFVMEMEGLDFKGALELLARRAGVDLDQYRGRSPRSGPDKERLYAALEAAVRFYQVQFSRNKIALEYVFKQRQFTKKTALEWRLGYAPNNGSALVDYLKKQNFTEAEIQQAGLTNRYKSDMFRGRLMIPLQDAQGRTIGFTARLLEDDDNAPKYINTPQTVLYDKSRHIYGLHLAKERIRKTKFVVVAEGNLDVIASHQAGVQQVVATAGTALTEQHLKALSRFTGDIRLSFDADRAGIAATERAIPIASKVKVTLSIITIPSGKDPDELIKQDPKLWQQTIEAHEYALDWLMSRYKKLLDLGSAVGKREYSDVLLPVVRGLTDPVEQDHYMLEIAGDIGVSREALEDKLKQTTAAPTQARKRRAEPQRLTSEERRELEFVKAQDHFLSLMLLQPPLREYLQHMHADMFTNEPARELLAFLNKHPDFDGNIDTAAKLKSVAEYVKILGLQYEELYQGLELTELHYEAARLQARLIDDYVKHQKQPLIEKINNVDDQTRQELLLEVKRLDDLLRYSKGGMHGQS